MAGGYAEAATEALPDAEQVADRWHLMENASNAFLNAVRKSMRRIRSSLGALTIDAKLLITAERLQCEGNLQREESHAAIAALLKEGVPIEQIVRRTGHSRGLVGQVARGARTEMCHTRQSSLERQLPLLDELWIGSCRKGDSRLSHRC